jgi:hypothetical protein
VTSPKFVNLSETKVISEIFLIYTKADDNAKIIHKIIEAKLNKNQQNLKELLRKCQIN